VKIDLRYSRSSLPQLPPTRSPRPLSFEAWSGKKKPLVDGDQVRGDFFKLPSYQSMGLDRSQPRVPVSKVSSWG